MIRSLFVALALIGMGALFFSPQRVTAQVGPAPSPRAYATNASSQIVTAQATTVPVSIATAAVPVSPSTTFPVSVASAVVVNTPAPAPTGAHGGIIIEGVSSGTVITVNTPAPFIASPTGGYVPGVQANPSSSPVPIETGGPHTLASLSFYNGAGATNFIQIFNNVAGSITLGSTAPLKVLQCPTLTYCFLVLPSTLGSAFSTGITAYCTTTATGSTGCATGTQLMWDAMFHADPCREPDSHLMADARDRWHRLPLACTNFGL